MCTVLLPRGVNPIAFNKYIDMGRVSSVGIATRHGLDGSGMEIATFCG